ncbi:MAG: DUF5652 family protein [Candidatus Doudnabacteria bacterium]|nr:DUF5652 family protein [Candidatus Doudnabacteria bacterium]
MNWQTYYGSFANPYGFKILVPVLSMVVVWSLVWKGMALWRAGRNGSKVWFVVLMLVNTLGILEILYLYKFGKKNSVQQIQ